MPLAVTFRGVHDPSLTRSTPTDQDATTSITAFIGRTPTGPTNTCIEVKTFTDFQRHFGGLTAGFPLPYAVSAFFNNGGTTALIVRLSEPGADPNNPLSLQTYLGDQVEKTGLYALEQAAQFNILCIPPDTSDGDTPPQVYQTAAAYCAAQRAMLILDPPRSWQEKYDRGDVAQIVISDLGSFSADARRSAAVYFPRMIAVDPLQNGRQRAFPASGAIAGIWAATDANRGVWKAPAGLSAALRGVVGLEANLTDEENRLLNSQGINCLRTFPSVGAVVWGARTLHGGDQIETEYKYIPVQRTMHYIASSVLLDTQRTVFERNDETLWARLRLSVGAFMMQLFRQGAFQGSRANEAYFVRCDATTTTQADIDAGFFNVVVGFAPLKPAEFVVITIQQMTGQQD